MFFKKCFLTSTNNAQKKDSRPNESLYLFFALQSFFSQHSPAFFLHDQAFLHQNASDVEVLRQANIEKSRQLIEVVRKRDYYDELFQSVLCGIVQYRPQADGSIVFQNANMEAIRIFGYEKEEFWKRKSWRIEDLAAPEDCDRVYHSIFFLLA